MSSRWEKSVLEQVTRFVDPLAVGGKAIRSAGLDPRLFDARPKAHPAPASLAIQDLYESLAQSARQAGRLPEGASLVKLWKLTGDIYSPKLGRFIEVDEYQHFSKVRLSRILENRFLPWGALYSANFWDTVLPRLQAKPYRDLDPPHRDEARAYRDELRERLPILYGLRQTIRLDEFTLEEAGLDRVTSLILEILAGEATNDHL
jgi:hypothetical protein